MSLTKVLLREQSEEYLETFDEDEIVYLPDEFGGWAYSNPDIKDYIWESDYIKYHYKREEHDLYFRVFDDKTSSTDIKFILDEKTYTTKNNVINFLPFIMEFYDVLNRSMFKYKSFKSFYVNTMLIKKGYHKKYRPEFDMESSVVKSVHIDHFEGKVENDQKVGSLLKDFDEIFRPELKEVFFNAYKGNSKLNNIDLPILYSPDDNVVILNHSLMYLLINKGLTETEQKIRVINIDQPYIYDEDTGEGFKVNKDSQLEL